MKNFGPELEPMNQLCEAWVRMLADRTRIATNPIYDAMREAEGVVSPGPPPQVPEEVGALDGILASCKLAGGGYYRMIEMFYTQGGSAEQKAKRLGLKSRDVFYTQLGQTLTYLIGRMEGLGWFIRGPDPRRFVHASQFKPKARSVLKKPLTFAVLPH